MKGGAILAVAALAGVAAGFLVGFMWGNGTRSALGDNTQTELSGGVLTVRVDAGKAATQGLRGILGV